MIRKVSSLLKKHSLLFFILWAIWLSFYYLLLTRVHDNADSVFSLGIAIKNNFIKYGFSNWAQFVAGGTDLVGLNSSPYFNFSGLILLLLPAQVAYWLMMFLQRFIAGYFTYRLCKDTLKLGSYSAFMSGMLYSIFTTNINGSLTFFNQFGEAGIPFLLWIIEKNIRLNMSFLKQIIFSSLLGITFGYFTSFALATPFIAPFVFVWFVFIRKIPFRKLFVFFSFFSICVLIIQSPTIVATALNAQLSQRTAWDLEAPAFKSYLKSLTLTFIGNQQIPFIISNFVAIGILLKVYIVNINNYIKLSVSAKDENEISIKLISNNIKFLIFSFFKIHLKIFRVIINMTLIKLLFLTLVSAILFPLYPIIRPLFSSYLGFLSNIGLERFSIISPFLIIIAASYAIPHLLEWKIKISSLSTNKFLLIPLKYPIEIVIITMIIFQSIQINALSMKEFMPFSVIYENPVLYQVANTSDNEFYRVASVISTESYRLHPMYLASYGLDIADGYIPMYSKRYHTFWEFVIKYGKDVDIGKNLVKFHQWGNRIYLFSPVTKSEGERLRFSDYYNLDLLSLSGVKYVISYFQLEDNQLKLLNFHQTQKTKSTLGSIEEKLLSFRNTDFTDLPINIYENESVLPKFFLVNNFIIFKNDSELLQKLTTDKISELKQSAYVVESEISSIQKDIINSDNKKLESYKQPNPEYYSPDKITFNLNLESAKILVLLNNFSPYWTAKVNNKTTRIFPVYHTFQGIYLQPGENKVEVEYKPPYFWTGLFKR